MSEREQALPMLDRLYDQYRQACACCLPEGGLDEKSFRREIGQTLAGMEHVLLNNGSTCEGVLYYEVHQEGSRQICDTPVFGYYASSEKTLTMLFSMLVERVLRGGDTLFQVRLYAHDMQARTLFSMMQFGYMVEKGVCRIDWDASDASADDTIRTLTKAEIEMRWPEIWSLTAAIIRHLQQPPVCYPGREFTEEVYHDFYKDNDTYVHAAFAEDGRMIGIIETNQEADFLVGYALKSVNVGEAYVLPDYRGSGLAHKLLQYAGAYERARGADYLWVEHGTANPNARRFWGKYFKSYQYEMDRLIERQEGAD